MSNITVSFTTDGVRDDELSGFFVGWPRPPSNESRRRILDAASEVVIGRDTDGRLVGFITAITDGVFAAYIPLLEVLPDRQHEGIGRLLVEQMLTLLRDCYMIDVVCDDEVVAFYEKLGGQHLSGMAWRNYERLAMLA